MPTIESLTEVAEPASPSMLGDDAYARFEREPDTLVIPVVQDGRPIGLIERNDFLMKYAAPLGRSQFAQRSVTHVMDAEPAVIDARVRLDTACETLLNSGPSALMRGFIVTRDGRYHGVGTAVSLLKAINERQQRQNRELAAQTRALSDTRAQALEAARANSRFLSVISDELRTPMNGVLAIAELLKRQPLNAQARTHLATIVDTSETLLRILDDALDLSRAEAGELALHPEPTPLRALMDEVAATWTRRAAQDGVTLMVSFEGDTELTASIDPTRLKQVFNNLIGHALKFARKGMVEASLRATARGDRIVLQGSVRDDGPTADADRVQADAEPFASEPGAESAGLGLSICRRIIERMDGRISAHNNAGRGTTFTFDLEAPQAVAETSASNVETLEDLDLRSAPHVLIVDDNATNRVVAQALCEMFGCTSESAEDGQEAVDIVQARPFDLILMDIKMPRLDGVQATQAIRALDGDISRVPIVALTANADPDDARQYLAAGMAAVVEKPIKPERLRMAMNLALATDAEATPASRPSQSAA